uniref:Caspase-8 n=1 Tax=Magallana gigas TaxID=29159 RepID=A0A8W8JCF3_MAGGI
MEENATRNSCLTLLNKIKEEMDCDEFRALAFLAKDHISGKRRKEYENCLELFNDLEKKAVIKCGAEGKINLGFLEQAFYLMGRKDLVSLIRPKVGEGPLEQSDRWIFASERRKTLYNVEKEIGQDKLKKLKALLRVKLRVRKRTMDKVKDVWDCLDIMEKRLLDSKLFPFLKNVYPADVGPLEIIDDFTEGSASAGAIGGYSIEETCAQEVAEHVHQHTNLDTENKTTLQLQSQLWAYEIGKQAGICIIINNEFFSDCKKHPPRCGTNVDRDSLRKLFTMFGYEIGLHENKTCLEIRHLLDEVRKKDHKDNGALVVCILSHGDFNTVTGACIFHPTDAVVKAEGDYNMTQDKAEMTDSPTLPRGSFLAEADFLIAFATMRGYASYRNGNGSFFIQSLVDLLRKRSPSQDVVSILVEVNHDVSKKFGQTEEGQRVAQIPEFIVRLTKKFFLHPMNSKV